MHTCPHCGIDILERGVIAVSWIYQKYDIQSGDYDFGDIGETERYICVDCGQEVPDSVVESAEKATSAEGVA